MTKKLLSAAAALFLCIGAFAQGIDFRSASLAEALEQGAKEKKNVFLDCYTSWCGPCKYMADNVFTLKEAGDYFNRNFVNIKIDMEKGEGVEIAKKYSIKAFPTFLILDSEGNELHRVVGGGLIGDFIARVDAGINNKKSKEVLQSEYESGKISKKDLTTYWQLARAGGSANREQASEVGKKLYGMLSKGDKAKEVYWPLVRTNASTYDSEGMDFILANHKKLVNNVGEQEVNSVVGRVFMRDLSKMLSNKATSEQNEQDPALKLAGQYAALTSRMSGVDFDGKASCLLMAELVGAKIENNLTEYIDILEARHSELQCMELVSVFEGAEKILPKDDAKRHYVRLSAIAGEISAAAKEEPNKLYFEVLSKNYRRRGNVGVYWEDFASLDDAIARISVEGKPIFLDCYTSWCGPCKQMAENVFTVEEVGDFFNERFINIKMDMEKGEGPKVAEKFGVRAYPTFVIIGPDGSMRHMIVGGDNGAAFIERVKEAFDDTKALGVLAQRYDAGDRNSEFLYSYMKTLKNIHNGKAADVAQTIFDSFGEGDKVSKKSWALIEDTFLAPDGSDLDKFLFANLDGFRDVVGREKVDQRIGTPYYQKLMLIVAGRDQKTTAADISRMATDIKSYGLEQGPMLLSYCDIAGLIRKGNLNVAGYKKAVRGLDPEKSLFTLLFSAVRSDLTPAQLTEWKAWGRELVAASDNPRFKQSIGAVIAQ